MIYQACGLDKRADSEPNFGGVEMRYVVCLCCTSASSGKMRGHFACGGIWDHGVQTKQQASFEACRFVGAPWRIRTVDTKRRRLVLYPAELMVRIFLVMVLYHILCPIATRSAQKNPTPPIFHFHFSANKNFL